MTSARPDPRGTSGWELAVVDMAGTTVADGGVVLAAVTAAIDEVEPDSGVDLDVFRRWRGAAKSALFEALVPAHAGEALEVFTRSLTAQVRGGSVQAVPGAEDALRRVRAMGVSVSLTTGFDRSIVDLIVDHLGWGDVADHVITGGEAGRGRPAPDLVLRSALEARVSTMDRVVVCGDTVNDLMSGVNAGAGLVVGVLSGAHDRATLESIPHAVVIDSVVDLPAVLAQRSPGGTSRH